jgi:hypothetical protein
MFFSVTECFYLPFPPDRGATRSKLFHVNKLLRFVHSGISCGKSFLVSLKSQGHIVRVASVVATIIAKKQIYKEGFPLPPRFRGSCFSERRSPYPSFDLFSLK